MATSDVIDVKVLANQLKKARILENDCLNQLIKAEPEMDGIYRDAQGRLWIRCFKRWRQLIIAVRDREFGFDSYWSWKQLVRKSIDDDALPFSFVAPITDEEVNF